MSINGAKAGMCFTQACEFLRASGKNLTDETKQEIKLMTAELYLLSSDCEAEIERAITARETDLVGAEVEGYHNG